MSKLRYWSSKLIVKYVKVAYQILQVFVKKNKKKDKSRKIRKFTGQWQQFKPIICVNINIISPYLSPLKSFFFFLFCFETLHRQMSDSNLAKKKLQFNKLHLKQTYNFSDVLRVTVYESIIVEKLAVNSPTLETHIISI